MCCIFTCCGWMIDLVQRLWTFTMSCCISSAVCCVLVTSSMSGIALGYNYSLAEYIDLKETNVSVYLKRGVFDDEIADDMDWRRSGKVPPHVQGQTNDLESGGGPEEMPLRSGRRLDDSLVVSDDQHNFEGSLMRLTARPPDARRHDTPEPVTSDTKLEEILAKYPMGSLEMMKAVHGLMNMRNSEAGRHTTKTTPSTTEPFEIGGRRVGNNPGEIPLAHYAPILSEMAKTFNPARLAVPDEGFRDPANWFLPKGQIPESYRRTMDLPNDDLMPDKPLTFPQPIRMSTKIFRPTRSQTSAEPVTKKMETLSDQDNANFKYGGDRDRSNNQPGPEGFLSESDYEEQANKGLPIRKKRNRRNAVKRYQSSHVTPKDIIFDISDTNAMKSTRSTLIDKLKSSIIKNAEELLSSTLSITPPLETRSSKIISTIVSLH